MMTLIQHVSFPQSRTHLSRRVLAMAIPLLLACALHANPTVRASLAADTIPLGGYTQLSIQVDGSTGAEVELPRIDGVVLRNSGTSQSTSIINGRVTRSSTIRITVLGEKEGTFTIPPIPVTVDGDILETQSLTLKVDNSAPRSGAGNSGSQSGSEGLTAEDIRRIARIELEIPSTALYVGQSVPLSVELWVNTAHRFDNLAAPTVRSENILIEALGQDFERAIEYEGDERFEVYRWNTAFTPIEPGAVSLQFGTEVSLLVRARRATSPFDSIFDSDFFAPSHRRIPILILSDPTPLEIRALPSNAPDAFSGAIGSFELSTTASPLQVQQGDPITLDIAITGEGNFDRVFHPGLSDTKGFRTYEPEAHWEPDPENPRSGRKTFKQAMIPTDASLSEIPSIAFSFFNPETGTFDTVKTAPIPITISGTTPIASDTPEPNEPVGTGLTRIQSDGWIPLQLNLDTAVTDLRPFAMQRKAWALVFASPIALAFLSWLIPLWIRHSNQSRANRLHALRRRLRTVDKAIAEALHSGDASAFVLAATQKTRLILGESWGVSPDSITSADAKSRLGSEFPALRETLEHHNAMQYSGGIAPKMDADALAQQLAPEWKQLIQTLEKS